MAKWEDIWSTTKDKFNSASIERCALRKDKAGQWHYFASYVDPEDGRWCISRLSAGRIENLDASQATPVFKARAFGLEGIKDPWIYERDGSFSMLVSVALPTNKTSEQSHSTLDIFNTGECVSATGLATSSDLVNWEWKGVVFAPEPGGWDRYCRRINSFIQLSNDSFLGFYDGSLGHQQNYEEKTGLAEWKAETAWKSLSSDQPFLTSPHASGSLRYIDAQRLGFDDALLFYEFARADSAHDLRLFKTKLSSIIRLCPPG